LRDLLLMLGDEQRRLHCVQHQRAHVADHLLIVDDAASRVAAVVAGE
jgi:hypothetical protein